MTLPITFIFTKIATDFSLKKKRKKKKENDFLLTIILPTSRIDAAIPEKQNPKEAEGRGAAPSPGTVWKKSASHAGKCFEAPRPRPLIIGYELFEEKQ